MDLINIYKTVAPAIVIGSFIGIAGYYGYRGFKKYQKLYNYVSGIKIKDEKPSVIIEDNHLIIYYTYLNDNYSVRIPYNQEMAATMTQYEVFGTNDKGEIKLTQQPGIPYLVKPSDLGQMYITVYDLGEDEERRFYDIPPFYGNIEE